MMAGMEAEARTDDVTDQFLTFVLAGEHYGVDILRVQEIRGWSQVTHIPNTPEYIHGVLNLRGTIVPIVDLRMRFGIERIANSRTTVIVVLRVTQGERQRTIGLVVDAVSDVCNVGDSERKPAPDFGASAQTEFISGMAAIDDKMVILLDVDRLFHSDELAVVDAAAGSRRSG
ncbi:MAG: chemotaxis protein CheW [Gammaproteobacteria bacterium]|nr:chemotaxis protein CheW [Gammaproteobacteria bacterium]